MKKSLILLTACLCVLTGCNSNIPPLESITKDNLASVTAPIMGTCTREELIGAWGEPDGMLSGMFGEIWELSEPEHRLTIYYDMDSVVEYTLIQYRETYTGTVTDRFTEGEGLDMADVISVDIGNGETMQFTFTDTTEYLSADTVSVGDTVTVVCDSMTQTDYHGIVSVEIVS